MLSIIVAKAKNNIIGKDNGMLWKLPDDLKRFKEKTTGHTIIMGRKTFESLGGILPNRMHIILSRNPDFNIDDSINARHASLFLMSCYMCTDMEIPELLVNNGASVYRTDVFGNNALILLILNDNMTKEQKLNGVAYLINEGADINWLNVQAQTPLTTALAKMELDIANYLIDRGAILYPAR